MKIKAHQYGDRVAKRLQSPEDAWVRGFATGVAEMHRRLVSGSDSAGVVKVCSAAGVTLALLKAAGVSSFDWRELEKAGVR